MAFIANLATNTCITERWNWSDECANSFTEVKNHLIEAPVLVHYDPKLPVRLAGDVSNYGIGAVLSHVDGKGQEHPIAFMPQTLSTSEKNYSQVEKEALSLIFGINKFRNYIYGRHFGSYNYTIEFRPTLMQMASIRSVSV